MKKRFLKLITITILLLLIIVACKKHIAVTNVTLNQSTLTLEVGTTEILVATIQPSDATNQVMIWESSNPFVATVLGNGLVTALSPGKTTITVHTEDGNKTASCAVKVEMPVTKEDLLTQDKGWQIVAATCDPPYESGSGDQSSDLFKVFLYDCELDDIIFFLKNKSQILDPGKMLCDTDYPIGYLGNWDLFDDDQLKFYFLDFEEPFVATILELDNSTLKLKLIFTIDYDKNLTTKYRGVISSKNIKNYTFTLKYTKAK